MIGGTSHEHVQSCLLSWHSLAPRWQILYDTSCFSLQFLQVSFFTEVWKMSNAMDSMLPSILVLDNDRAMINYLLISPSMVLKVMST